MYFIYEKQFRLKD